ncbi:murein biosynthesis integral membrane protein MurJ [Aerococcaceae bacterium DSM 111176]|nr:murein biosynthesis integral membrane protein MurJ [Aerococcaceae bacterium DSM 111176]
MRTTITVILLTILAKLFGFARNIVLSYFFGASAVSDAYLVALSIPEVLYDFIIIGISTSFIPIFSQVRLREGDNEAIKFTNNVINHVLLFTLGLFYVGYTFANQIVQIFATGFYGERLNLTIELTQLVLLSMFFTSVVTILNGYLQQKRNFIIPALVGIPLNLSIIVGIILAYYFDQPLLLGASYSVATLSQLFFVLPAAYKNDFKYRFTLDTKNPYLFQLVKVALPVMIGTSVNQINVLVNRTISSQLAVGSISALNYSYQLVFFVQSVFALSVSSMIFPIMSDYAVQEDFVSFKKIISKTVNLIYLIIFPITVGAIIFPEQVVDLLFGRGNFDGDAIRLTAYALIGYAVGMIANALREVLSRSFYALGDSKTPMKNAMFGVVINVVSAILLSRTFGIMGLSLASSLASIVTTILLFIEIRRKVGQLNLRLFALTVFKSSVAGIIMGIVCLVAYQYLVMITLPIIALAVSIVLGAVTYFVLLILLREQEILEVLSTITSSIKQIIKRS